MHFYNMSICNEFGTKLKFLKSHLFITFCQQCCRMLNGEPLKRKKTVHSWMAIVFFFKEKTSKHYNNFCLPLWGYVEMNFRTSTILAISLTRIS